MFNWVGPLPDRENLPTRNGESEMTPEIDLVWRGVGWWEQVFFVYDRVHDFHFLDHFQLKPCN